MLNLCAVLEHNARAMPEKTAIHSEGDSYCFARLNAHASQLAGVLAEAGIQRGDRVALMCTTQPWFAVAFYGVLKTGAVVTPLNPLLTADDIAYCLSQSEATALLCEGGSTELPVASVGWEAFEKTETCARSWCFPPDDDGGSFPGDSIAAQMQGQSDDVCCTPTGADDLAMLIYTSGTTGRPKGAALTHANIVLNSMLVAQHLGYSPMDELVVAVPMYHSMGLVVLMSAGLYAGATLHLQPRFDPIRVLEAMAMGQGTFFCGVPTMYHALLQVSEEQYDRPAVAVNWRLACCGGSPVPAVLVERLMERFETPMVIGYGLSETSPIVSMTAPLESRPYCVGSPLWGIDVEIRTLSGEPAPRGERGEICVRGHNVMQGYYRNTEANAAAFYGEYFRTGDIGYLDDAEHLYVVDRCKDVIIRGGNNVYPAEVEQAILKHSAVSRVAVIGRPHDTLGEEVEAVVELAAGVVVSEEELRAWCREHIDKSGYPRIVTIVEMLPLGPTGKVLKRVVRGRR